MPAVALLGSRQVGKTTLALEISKNYLNKSVSYMDLELDSDLAKLDDAESYLRIGQKLKFAKRATITAQALIFSAAKQANTSSTYFEYD